VFEDQLDLVSYILSQEVVLVLDVRIGIFLHYYNLEFFNSLFILIYHEIFSVLMFILYLTLKINNI
jgi:hypothetical protein